MEARISHQRPFSSEVPFDPLDEEKLTRIHPVQYAVQLTFRIADTWAFNNSFVTLGLNYFTNLKLSQAVSYGLKSIGLAGSDIFAQYFVKPLVSGDRSGPKNICKQLCKEGWATTVTFIVFGLEGAILDDKPSSLTQATIMANICYQNPFSSSLILGVKGLIFKGPFSYWLRNTEDRNLLKVAQTPENLNWGQKGAHYVFRFIGASAWLEALRNVLVYHGETPIVNDPSFLCLIMAMDALRQTLNHLSYVPRPLDSLVQSKFASIRINDLEQGEVQSSPTLVQICKAIGSKAIHCITSAVIICAVDRAFDAIALEENSNLSLLFRVSRELALFTAYVSLPGTVIYAKNRYTKWMEQRRQLSESNAIPLLERKEADIQRSSKK